MSWIPYDYEDDTANPLPGPLEQVWVNDIYHGGVTVGAWQGAWWETWESKDDIFVTHWMPIDYPSGPE